MALVPRAVRLGWLYLLNEGKKISVDIWPTVTNSSIINMIVNLDLTNVTIDIYNPPSSQSKFYQVPKV